MRIRWKKIIICTLDVVLAGYLVMATTSFNKPDEKGWVCHRVNIDIEDESTNGFITTAEIKDRLAASHLYPLGKPMTQVRLRAIEETLEKSPFVNKAESYKTQNGDVNIHVTQRLPVVRIKADNGDDYYVDDQDRVMPNSHYTSDLVIATGNISRDFATRYIPYVAKAINDNPLWQNLVVQINVCPDRSIEIVPRVGDFIVNLGHLPAYKNQKIRQKAITDYMNKQLTRLQKFYRYGLTKAGWNKYSYINLEFENQIICKKRENYR